MKQTVLLKPFTYIFSCILVTIFLGGCTENSQPLDSAITPLAIESGDECHLCGMIITNFPGPKGQAVEGKNHIVHKFCSTRDLLSWYLQPENKPNTKAIFVHAMENTDWHKPDNHHMIPAQDAWFVKGSTKTGAMGPTLASFSTKGAAEAFKNQYQGEILKLEEITMQDIMMSMKHHH